MFCDECSTWSIRSGSSLKPLSVGHYHRGLGSWQADARRRRRLPCVTHSRTSTGSLLTSTLPNGVVSSYAYDEAGRLLSIFHEAEPQLLSSFEYEYDPNGNRTQAQEYYLTPGAGPVVLVEVADEQAATPWRASRCTSSTGPPTPASTRPPTRAGRPPSRCRRGASASGRMWTACSSGATDETTAPSPAAPACC